MVETSTIISDTVTFIRDDLRTNITDTNSSARSTDSNFVMTSYPQRPVEYPLITVRHVGSGELARSGLQSEIMILELVLEIRIWSRNSIESDRLFQEVYNRLRSNQFGVGSTRLEKLHDFKLLSTVVVDEPTGKKGEIIHSKIMEIRYIYLTED